MSVDIRSSDRRRYMNELQAREKEIEAGLLKASLQATPKALQENEKRMRREIANSNERRRMQCINAGFCNLRALIPQLEGEKLSKAAILQHATEYITSLEKDKSRLQIQLEHTRGLLSELGQDRAVTSDPYVSSSPPPPKRKKRDTESSDEGICSLSDASDDSGSELQQANVALRHQMDVERQRCASLEDRNRILEAQLLAVLHVQAPRAGSLNDLHAVKFEHLQLQQQQELYSREMVEVVAAREPPVPSSRFDPFQPPERGLPREASAPLDVSTHRPPVNDSSHFGGAGEPMDVVPAGETSLPGAASSAGSSPTTVLSAPEHHSHHHHHNYCHRDHPRRRHRQQAQLDQQREEEELRRQMESEQELSASTPCLYRPKRNTQNLEKLVEAIRQIEGDRVLCKFYEEEHKLKYQSAPNEESERETSSVSDQDEPKSESSGRDSPLHHHLHHYNLQQQHNITSDELATSNNGASYSEKYPIASHLLHRPIHPSYYRPGVIVHKH